MTDTTKDLLGNDLTASVDHGSHGHFTFGGGGPRQIQGSLHHDPIKINPTRPSPTAPAPTVTGVHEGSSSTSDRETPSP